MKMSPAVLVLMAAMLAACSELQQFTAGLRSAGAPVQECDINRVMRDLQDVRAIDKDQLQETLKLWEQAYQANPTDSNRLRLALLYAAGDQSVRDTARAQELLTGSADTISAPGERELAALVRQLLAEQTDAYRKINALNKQVAEQNKRIAELEHQQRALMSIEQKIQQRDTPAVIDDGK
jgi:hypothetical protein